MQLSILSLSSVCNFLSLLLITAIFQAKFVVFAFVVACFVAVLKREYKCAPYTYIYLFDLFDALMDEFFISHN